MSNTNPNTSIKGYKLPFGLKMKPIRHYFAGGSIYFIMEGGKLYARVTRTGKEYKTTEPRFEVTSKEELDGLRKVKSINEIPIREVVRY